MALTGERGQGQQWNGGFAQLRAVTSAAGSRSSCCKPAHRPLGRRPCTGATAGGGKAWSLRPEGGASLRRIAPHGGKARSVLLGLRAGEARPSGPCAHVGPRSSWEALLLCWAVQLSGGFTVGVLPEPLTQQPQQPAGRADNMCGRGRWPPGPPSLETVMQLAVPNCTQCRTATAFVHTAPRLAAGVRVA